MRVIRYPIRPVLEHYGFTLTDKPGKVCCQFHGDEHASAVWSEFNYKCFACDAHGDAVRLLVEQEGITFAEAYKRAEELSGGEGVEVPEAPRTGPSLPGKQGLHGTNRNGLQARGR